MKSIDVSIETGKKRIFVCALDWPGWCRSARDEVKALQTLIDYSPRYAQVLHGADLDFQIPESAAQLSVIEKHDGNVTTDFGAPAIIPDADKHPMHQNDFERFQTILDACWRAFDLALGQASDKELRKGPRGGGRDLEKIVEHVLDADRSYLSRLAWKHRKGDADSPAELLQRRRQEILDALEVAVKGDLPERGPRGGIIWPPRYFVRRVAWHVLDHAWEIEDRII
jgi:hypothetical protein